ncbi:translation initiation factor IF-2 [Candidatus Peregrinibacteria bacterium CG_4_10_14_0_2_um_filter_43_11]|nr:MAG: translation initiation factor IF-2 [Candidatus Peregrinibacteria bacterium CG_4_10_14_0_2_um_filter_43_11]
MRLAEIAKELRITTQELRRELEKTNFGISATAHEVDDNLGKGIVRFLKVRVKPTLTHRRVAVVFKDGKEERVEDLEENEEGAPEETSTTPSEKNEENMNEPKDGKKEGVEAGKKEEAKPEYREDRSQVPQPSKMGGSPLINSSLKVSRRIELDAAKKETEKVDVKQLPKHYYKSKKKHKGKGHSEDEILETMRRHPHTGKIKVAKVNYDTGDAVDNLSAEEIAIEREDDRQHFRSQKKHRAVSQKRGPKAQPQIKTKTGIIEVPAIVSLKEFAEKTGLPVTDVIAGLMKNGMMATINQKLDFETASIIAAELGVEVKQQQIEATAEALLEGDLKTLLKEEDPALLQTRPPIISVMGHVDHGKTKLLDAIRDANVIATESGGITQHIGAYQVEKNGKQITFLDTPGHEAFTSMRARGAKATDIAILVVAADEGVKPQTVEAIHHAQEAGIPIIVAINKMDKPGANPDKVKGELVEYGLQAEDWGGKTVMVPISALKGEGIDNILEMILLTAEMEDLKANPNRPAVGTVVESHLNPSLGPVATVLINTGTMRVGDNVIVGNTLGRIKTMQDHKGKNLKIVSPSGAARISGLDEVPQAGDILQVMKDEKTAKQRLQEMAEIKNRQEESMSGSMVERIVSQINTGSMSFLKLVLKADTKGSLEAITQALVKVKSKDVAIKIIHFGVGNIADTDIIMGAASQALVIGFHVEANMHVRKLAEKNHVDIKNYTVIYKLIEDMKAILSGMLEPEIKIHELGKIEIKQIFLNKKVWVIAGGKVIQGKAESKSMVRLIRDGETLFETNLESLKHVKEDVNELEKGSDCGFKIKTPKPVQEGDVLEVFKVEKVERHLD